MRCYFESLWIFSIFVCSDILCVFWCFGMIGVIYVMLFVCACLWLCCTWISLCILFNFVVLFVLLLLYNCAWEMLCYLYIVVFWCIFRDGLVLEVFYEWLEFCIIATLGICGIVWHFEIGVFFMFVSYIFRLFGVSYVCWLLHNMFWVLYYYLVCFINVCVWGVFFKMIWVWLCLSLYVIGICVSFHHAFVLWLHVLGIWCVLILRICCILEHPGIFCILVFCISTI